MNAERDPDGDGLSCREECLTGTDPLKRDTEGDGRDGALETGGWCLRHDCAHGVCACDGDARLKMGVGDSAPAASLNATEYMRTNQTFKIDANGTVSVAKYGWRVARSVSGHVSVATEGAEVRK